MREPNARHSLGLDRNINHEQRQSVSSGISCTLAFGLGRGYRTRDSPKLFMRSCTKYPMLRTHGSYIGFRRALPNG